MVKLRNPLSTGGDYVGAWSRDSAEWDEVPPHEKDRLGTRYTADGEFWYNQKIKKKKLSFSFNTVEILIRYIKNLTTGFSTLISLRHSPI